MKNKKLFLFYILLAIFVIALLWISFGNLRISQNLFVSFIRSNHLYIINYTSGAVARIVDLNLPYSPFIVLKIIRVGDSVYVITDHAISLFDQNGEQQKMIFVDELIRDAIPINGKLYVLSIFQKLNISCDSENAYDSYITVYNSPLSQISKTKFENHRLESLTYLNGKLYASSFIFSNLVEITNSQITNKIQLLNNTNPTQLLSFNNKIIVVATKKLFTISPTFDEINELANESTCNKFTKATIYKNLLYATCFSENKTIVFDLNQNKMVAQINTPSPFYVLPFNDKIYVTSVVAKKIFVIDPASNTVVATLSFEEQPRVIG